MSVFLASDTHGAHRKLQASQNDFLLLLGDYPDLLDYFDLTQGILARLFPQDVIVDVLNHINNKDRVKARESMRKAAGSFPDLFNLVKTHVQQCYTDLFASLPCKSKLIFGNTDFPELLQKYASPDTEIIGQIQVFATDGLRIAMISGVEPGPHSFGMPGEVDSKIYASWVADLPPVDILCSHGPPAVIDLTYDVSAERDEGGSEALLEYIHKFRPRYHFYGHIHQPKKRQAVIGSTVCINLACFRDRPWMVRMI